MRAGPLYSPRMDANRAPLRIGWFATGQGTGSRTLLAAAFNAIRRGELAATIPFLFCNREPGEHPNSDLLLAMAAGFDIPVVMLSDRRFRRRAGGAIVRAGEPLPAWRLEYDHAVLEAVAPYHTDIGMLAGYMLIFGPEACARYTFLNLHPAAPGGPIGTWQRVIWHLIEQRAPESGVLINRVIPAVDEGPVIAFCRYSLRTPAFLPLWRALGEMTADQLQEQDGETAPLFAAIRAAGVAREQPLMVQTLVALAQGRLCIKDGLPYVDGVLVSGGLDLTAEVEDAIRRSS